MDDFEPIEYPPGCDELSNNLEISHLLKRLKMIAKSFYEMPDGSRESETFWKYNDLALYLASPFFVSHHHEDVKLLTAYCIANVLRVCQKSHPYTNLDFKKLIAFLFNQLGGLRNKDTKKNKLCQKLLEILVKNNVSQLYSELENIKQLVIDLFETVINTVRLDMSIIVQDLIVTLLGILFLQLPLVPDQIIRMIFFNFKNKNKSSNRAAYEITIRLIQKYKNILAPAIGKFLVKELFGTFLLEQTRGSSLERTCKSLPTHWMSRLWKLHAVCSDVAVPVMLRLESALMTPHLDYRLTLIIFLARLFSTPCQVPVYKDYSALWKAFLGRFNDENPDMRMLCLEQLELLFKIKDLRGDLLWTLGKREMDPSPKIRIAVVSVVSSLIQAYPSVADAATEDFFPILERRRLDGEVMVRLVAIEKMAEVFSFFCNSENTEDCQVFLQALETVSNYPKYILFNFWINPPNWMQDRLVVIQQLNGQLVPNRMTPEARIKKLLKLWMSFDLPTCSTLVEIRYLQHTMRECLLEVISLLRKSKGHHSQEEKQAILNALAISCNLPLASGSAFRIVMSFAMKINRNENHLKSAETILHCKSSCEETVEAMNVLMNELKLPPDFALLLDLTADLLVDRNLIKMVVQLLDDILQGKKTIINDLDVDTPTAIGKIFNFLQGVTFSNSSHFFDEGIIRLLISWLQMQVTEDNDIQLKTLKILAGLQPSQISLMEEFPALRDELIFICEKSCTDTNIMTAKWGLRSLAMNPVDMKILYPIFLSIFETLGNFITSKNMKSLYDSIYCLGYITYHIGNYFEEEINSLISDKVTDNIMSLIGNEADKLTTWYDFDCLPIETQIKVRFIKFLGQCLNTVTSISFSKILNILFKVIQEGGYNVDCDLLSPSEKSWMRLAAGCSVLQILRGKQMSTLTCEQFYQIAKLMTDKVEEVRNKFFQKFTASMMKEFPRKSLPLGFLGIYMLIDVNDLYYDKAKQNCLISEMNIIFSRRLSVFANYKKSSLGPESFDPNNHILVYGLLVAARNEKFSNHHNLLQLKILKKQMQIFLNALLMVQDDLSFYLKQVHMVKNHTVKGGDKKVNLKLWTLCDLALMIMESKHKRNVSENKTVPTLPMEFFESKPRKNSNRVFRNAVLSQLWPAQSSPDARQREGWSHMEMYDLEEGEEEVEDEEKTVLVGEGVMAIEEDGDNRIWEVGIGVSGILKDEEGVEGDPQLKQSMLNMTQMAGDSPSLTYKRQWRASHKTLKAKKLRKQ